MNRRTVVFAAVFACLGTASVVAQSRAQDTPAVPENRGHVEAVLPTPPPVEQSHLPLLRQQLLYRGGPSLQEGEADRRRNVFLAFGLSALVPGAGQIYNRNWIKAGIGLALEAAMWTGYVLWKQDGERMREEYRAYAHEHYSPVRYAEWLNTYPGYEGESIPTGAVSDAIDFSRPDDWSEGERRQVRQFIDEIQAAERQSSFAAPPYAAFSHQLPHFGEQQYYELIGKYHQYAPGWDDCGEECGVQSPSDRFYEYAEIHGEANTLLRRASRVTAFVVINHGLAAVDAAITAQLHNNSLDTDLSLRRGIDGTARPHLTMVVSF